MSHGAPSTQSASGTMYKLTILGDGGVGKTALVIQLCLKRFVETYDPTIEDSYRKRVLLEGRATTLEIMDTAGQEQYASLQDQWIRDGEGFLLVYSITERSSFESLHHYYEEIVRVKDGEGFGLVLVGNKCDEEDARVISPEEGERLARSWGVPFFETSAKFDINGDYAFLQTARVTRDTRTEDSPPSSRSSFDRGAGQNRQGSYSSMHSAPSVVSGATAADVHAQGLYVPTGDYRASRDSVRAPDNHEPAQPYSGDQYVPNGSAPVSPKMTHANSAPVPNMPGGSGAGGSGASGQQVRAYYGRLGDRSDGAPSGAAPPQYAAAVSIAESDGGDTIVAAPRRRRKKSKCAIM